MEPQEREDSETLLVQFKRLYIDAMRVFERKLGMSQARILIMSELLHEREVSQAELQLRLGVDGAAITRQVKQLEREGYIARRANPNDNRVSLVSLTPRGRRELTDLVKARLEFEDRVLDGIDSETRKHLRQVLKHIHSNIRALD
ncbi:hypothetical protein KSC_046740 [Ktedonobacter sp. SOSP1-52]|uniref:MarR family winged helix-turn-helix transcriptional regulator n=1 Tax=Ktedonobacter sp. SOSP1-52 TaxID=2778366 RepID=UPI001916B9FC|nr:MarR family transcriptional regulator [Ktedonobacter sp. SOSP1-52]GHO65782.1 hypothetical protein KSC_046740 [Ktedonobacter sp. SOSP1-52]